jgi:tetratricopeptide (TPR) repeat protein
VEWYTRSLQLDPLSAITVANRAMAHLQLKEYVPPLSPFAAASALQQRRLAHLTVLARSYATAEADSEQAIALDATYVKAYMRRGTARKALGKLDLALEGALPSLMRCVPSQILAAKSLKRFTLSFSLSPPSLQISKL